jgi:hypothetical protein
MNKPYSHGLFTDKFCIKKGQGRASLPLFKDQP